MVLTSSEIKIMASKAMERLNKAYEEQHIEKPSNMQEYLRGKGLFPKLDAKIPSL